MSLSRPTATNPAGYMFEWKNGQIEFYNKETEKTIKMPFPFEFIALDQLHGVTGWSDHYNVGIWSTEVRSTKNDITVFAGKHNIYVGPYKDEKKINQVAGFGGRYCRIVYIALKSPKTGEWGLHRLKLTGAAFSAWYDYEHAHNPEGVITRITGAEDKTKGATNYQTPTFEYGGKPTDDVLQIARDLDAHLQTYLDTYLTAPKYDDNADPISQENFEDTLATAEQIADFEAKKAQQNVSQVFAEPLPEPPAHMDDEPINLDDIPF